MEFKSACDVKDIPEGRAAKFTVDGTNVVIYHLKDGFFATQCNCTHLFAALHKGKILDDSRIRCWFHRAEFDIRTGKAMRWANFPPGVQLMNIVRGEKDLEVYKTKVENNQVFVELS